MPVIDDPATLAEQAVLIGLLTREQVQAARDDAGDGSLEAFTRTLLGKQMLTSWQVDKLKKGDLGGFFFGGCKVLFHIAEGTFARVYRGVRVRGQQSVAIKLLRQRFVADPEAVVRFKKEAEAGQKLVHPNIVQTYDFGEEDKKWYMILEYVEGSNLRDFLRIRKRLGAAEAFPLMLGLARGLQYSLSKGVTHRDIKGTNILIASQGVAKLVDFGLATIEADDKKDNKKMAIAHGQTTVDYSALERTCNSPKGDPRSDIFFLGCVFYQMLTGQLPLPEVESKDPLAKMLRRSFGAIKPLSEQFNAPPEEMSRIVEKMMKVDLKARYQNMDDVVRDLEAYAATQAASLPTVSPVARAAAVATEPEPEEVAEATEPESEPADEPIGDDFFDHIFEQPAAAPKSVLCVEAQEEVRDVFAKTFAKMGYQVILAGDAERAAAEYRRSPPDLLVFDADGLGPKAIETFLDIHGKASKSGHLLASLVLLGPKDRELSSRLPTDKRLVVLAKPIKLRDIRDAIAQIVPTG